MSTEAPIIASKYSYLIGGSGGTGKCSQNYVAKYTVNKMSTFNINFYHFGRLFHITRTYMQRVQVSFDISPIFQKFTFLKNESVTA